VVETGGLERRFRPSPKALKIQLNPFASRHLPKNWASLDFRLFCLFCATFGDNLVTVEALEASADKTVTDLGERQIHRLQWLGVYCLKCPSNRHF
jgi:hypothetical protein